MARPYPARSGTSWDSHHGRAPVASDQPFTHSSRSWMDNGVHYTMQTASYTSPGFSFDATGGGAGRLFNNFSAHEVDRTTHTHASGFGDLGIGLLGTAVNLLGAMGDMRHTSQPHSFREESRERHVQHAGSDDDISEYEDDLAYGQMDDGIYRDRPRSMFSRLKNKLNDNRQRTRKVPYSREASPAQRPRSRRQHSFREEAREAVYVEVEPESADGEAFEKRHQRPKMRRPISADGDMLRNLQATVKSSRKELERASRQQHTDTRILQALLNEVESNEQSLASAEQNLQSERCRTGRVHGRNRAPRTSVPPQAEQSLPIQLDGFGTCFTTVGVDAFPAQPRGAHSLFAEIEDFHNADPFMRMFNAPSYGPFSGFGGPFPLDHDLHTLFGIPAGTHFAGVRSERPQYGNAHSGAHSRPSSSYAAFHPMPPQRPPPTLLQPGETEALFRTYNERWSELSPIDPNVPYPARGLRASALQALDTLWAPAVSSPLATWSEENVMQANVQAFFLGVVGLDLQYSETGGRVTMGYDRARASAAQVKQLVDILKKEKTRWHSDRLGRRHGGRPGPNEALQSDPRARAVFHAVCELMETAQ
ncbi:CorA metal ion transporter [Teratosphaeriaceae sp. CCFEE 6253]|nr:CorA metal ion transporter [Teratosphaeriaceae sp. CCFEE 6253]